MNERETAGIRQQTETNPDRAAQVGRCLAAGVHRHVADVCDRLSSGTGRLRLHLLAR